MKDLQREPRKESVMWTGNQTKIGKGSLDSVGSLCSNDNDMERHPFFGIVLRMIDLRIFHLHVELLVSQKPNCNASQISNCEDSTIP